MGNILGIESFTAEDNGSDTLTITYFDNGIETKIVLQTNLEQPGARDKMASRTIYRKANGLFPSATTSPDDWHKFTYTSLQCYGISKGFGQDKMDVIITDIQKSVSVAKEPFQLVAVKSHNEPSYFVLDFVDVPAGNGIMSCITATRDRPGISTIVKFVDRVMRPSL